MPAPQDDRARRILATSAARRLRDRAVRTAQVRNLAPHAVRDQVRMAQTFGFVAWWRAPCVPAHPGYPPGAL